MIAKTLSRLGIEVWKDIPEYEGLYQVSNLGNVRSLNYNKTGKANILKTPVNPRGYARVNLSLYKKQKVSKVHSLVARAFLKHKPCGMKIVVDHIDNNPLNNNLYNLQLITQRENCSKDKKGTSKYTGVSWSKSHNRWVAHIRINGVQKNLGLFTDEKEAAQVYQNELNKIK